MPSKLLDALLVVLLYKLLTLVLVVSKHDTLQECIWELKLTNLLLTVCTNILHELEVLIYSKLLLQTFCNLSTESLLILNLILTEQAIEQLLINSMLSKARDLCNLIAEVSSKILSLLTLNLKKSSNLAIVLWISLLWVESDDITWLATIEELLLILNLDV